MTKRFKPFLAICTCLAAFGLIGCGSSAGAGYAGSYYFPSDSYGLDHIIYDGTGVTPTDSSPSDGGDQVSSDLSAFSDTTDGSLVPTDVGAETGCIGQTCCTDASNCDDGDPCTTDSCSSSGSCTHVDSGSCPKIALPCDGEHPCLAGVCDLQSLSCVTCLTSSDCGGLGDFCQGHACINGVPCKSDLECKTSKQVCDKSQGVCVDCVQPGDCGSQMACTDHKCVSAVPCSSSKDCTQVCNLKGGVCVACLTADDCQGNQFCDSNHQCQLVLCQAGLCNGDQAFACKPDGSGYSPGKSCNDGNPCTDDTCKDGGVCGHKAHAGACDDGDACTTMEACIASACKGQPVDCDDQNPCTDDSCDAQAGCQHTSLAGKACDDGNPCTSGEICQAGACTGISKNCDDGNACTTDSCDAIMGCVHKGSGAACDDGNACTVGDDCLLGTCSGAVVVCNDNNTCTLDTCDNKLGCQHQSTLKPCDDGSNCTSGEACDAKGVCTGGVGMTCDDKDPCTKDSCNNAICSNIAIAGCCSKASQCDDGIACSTDLCVDNQCVHTGICCANDAQCSDGNACTTDTCGAQGVCGHQVTPGGPIPLISGDFEGDLGAWTANAVSGTFVWAQKSGKSFKTGTGAANFAKAGIDTFTGNNTLQVAELTSPLLALQAGTPYQLDISWRLDVTPAGQGQFDLLIDTGTGVPTLLATAKSTANTTIWTTQSLDLSPLAGSTVKLIVRATITGSVAVPSSGTGLWLDAVKLSAQCAAKSCTTANDCATTLPCASGICLGGTCSYSATCCANASTCDDKNGCTTDSCTAGKCAHALVANCCSADGDCKDSNVCTLDTCKAGKCSHGNIAGCCTTNVQCDDADSCTQDSCNPAGLCLHVATCCKVNGDCNDFDNVCTTDTCVGGVCKYTSTGAPGCCKASIYAESFDSGSLSGWTFTNSTGVPTQGWQLWKTSTQAQTPPGVLYYGDPTVQNYAFSGANNGTALSPTIAIAAGSNKPTLKFWLYMDTEGGGTYDILTVNVLVGGVAIAPAPWSKVTAANLTMKAWTEISVDLSAQVGKTIQLSFVFNTGDGVANSTFGVAVDELRVLQTCP